MSILFRAIIVIALILAPLVAYSEEAKKVQVLWLWIKDGKIYIHDRPPIEHVQATVVKGEIAPGFREDYWLKQRAALDRISGHYERNDEIRAINTRANQRNRDFEKLESTWKKRDAEREKSQLNYLKNNEDYYRYQSNNSRREEDRLYWKSRSEEADQARRKLQELGD